jgi:hypothetical protein
MEIFILNYELRLLGAKVGIAWEWALNVMKKMYVYILSNIHLVIPN